MFDIKIVTVLTGFLVYLYSVQVEIYKNKATVETTIYNLSYTDVFDFVTNPDSVDKWFRWISQVTHGDYNPIGQGKRYNVLFTATPIVFETKTFTAENGEFQMSFESNTILRPSFELRVFRTCRFLSYPRTKVSISLNFKRSSMLFRITMGKILQNVGRERMKEALHNLDYIFKHFADYGLHKMI